MDLIVLGLLGVVLIALGVIVRWVGSLCDAVAELQLELAAWRASEVAAIARAQVQAEARAERRGRESVRGRLAARQERVQ